MVPPTLEKSSEVDLEASRVTNQAKLGHWLREATVRRCQGFYSKEKGRCQGHHHSKKRRRCESAACIPMGTIADCYPPGLQMHEERWVTKLTGVTMIPREEVGGEAGTLEAHLNGFIYSTPSFIKIFMHADVEAYFYRLGGGRMQPPLLQFHMKRRIRVGNEKTKDIQFRLASAPLEKVDRGGIRNADVKEFVSKVQETQWICGSDRPFTRVEFDALDDFQFEAAFTDGESATFALTRTALVVLEEESPYTVVQLMDIQIVNLACLGRDKIEMTVVFRDLKRHVLEICSIPLKFLNGIKDRLNSAEVKYFVNNLRPKWRKLLSEIRECPKKFIDNGGWDFLEDSLTLASYPPRVDSYSYLFEDEEDYEIFF